MEIELLEIREFLAAHPPFDQLGDDVLDRLPKELSVRYLRRGSPFPPEDADGAYLYIVRTGALELRDRREDLVAKFGEGDLYPSACLEDQPDAAFRGITVEDSLLYLLPCEQFERLQQEHPGFSAFFNQSVRERLRRALQMLQDAPEGGAGLMAVEVRELISREPVHTSPETTVREAAHIMNEQRVSALFVMEAGRLTGVVTDRDLRSRCIATGLDTGEPVTAIMTRKLHKIPPDMPAFEALLTMSRLGVHHLPVIDGNRMLGVISTTDLVRYQSANAVYVVGDVRKCQDLDSLVAASRQLPELQVHLTHAGAGPHHLGQAVSTVVDALTIRLLELGEERLGPPPVPYCWLAVGSQARHEQTVHSDQDNALVLADEATPAHDAYFAELAAFVSDGLSACGFVYCPGETMATNPEWRQPLAQWCRRFDNWIDAPEKKSLMLLNNFFDIRPVFGDETLSDRLRAHVLQKSRSNGIFVAFAAAHAVRSRPPLGFFRNFVLVHDGEHDKTLDLKRSGILPITDLARVYALSAGLPEVNTFDRLRAAAEAMAVSDEGAANLEDALEFIAVLRARHQAAQIKRGIAPDNFVDPDELSRLERSHLKDAFAIISTMQSAMAQSYQSERFT